MKFAKEYESQMILEWQQAYMDYNHLKILLKDIFIFRNKNNLFEQVKRKSSLNRMQIQYRAFSGFTSPNDVSPEDEAILVSEGREGSTYQTMFLRLPEEGGKFELIFFSRLDKEFNKVVKFYKEKVQEMKNEAKNLSQQMDALIALRIRVHDPLRKDQAEEILDHVKIKIEPETPITTLKTVLKHSSESDLSFSKTELKQTEEKMREAFVEFYRKLQLLKNFSLLNQLAISKIMKKYDKITSRNASKSYLAMVDKSCLGTLHEVSRLIIKVETIYIKYFSKGNRRKGMKFLRPLVSKERHRITFTLGLFTGCSIALIIAIIVVMHARNLLESHGHDQYMENIFPLYSLFGYIILHMVMYGGNIYFWRRFRVNYPFIYGFKQGTELNYRKVLLLASGLSVLALAATLSNLDMEMEPRTKSYETLTELVPLSLVIVVLAITFCPFNIIYRSSRFFFVRCVWHCLCAPFYKVDLPDFFMADQLTSQVQAIRSLLFYGCYYGYGNFKKRTNKCAQSNLYQIFNIIVAIIPFWSRFLQCVRRCLEEKDSMQGLNSLKYFSTIIALVMRTMYSQKGGTNWKIMATVSSGLTTVVNTYWDVVLDWGLLRRGSKNRWLRDKLLVPYKIVYFAAIVINILLRLVWMQLILDFNETPFLHQKVVIAIVASLEIIRRGIWNFFRLENEQLNNVGKYRAYKHISVTGNCGVWVVSFIGEGPIYFRIFEIKQSNNYMKQMLKNILSKSYNGYGDRKI